MPRKKKVEAQGNGYDAEMAELLDQPEAEQEAAHGKEAEPEEAPNVPNYEAESEQAWLTLSFALRLFGVDEIPEHISVGWKASYRALCEKYQFSMLGTYAAEIGFLVSNFLLYQHVKAVLASRQPEPEPIPEPTEPFTDESNRPA